ncbi:hypothetical protein COS51_00110 [Candidatus Roizmanbacteria bacterium CG03_land_8_20_14_0_80_36_21]|nr:MAG: hypothetical protein COS51_00110 [Candidatus Roizmanbacteria bacterium CG03_land_8_20_14_0_80_36_21]
MIEGKIYYFLKHFLLNKGWTLLAGEPPDGSDNVCRIEIRNKNRVGIGSKGSYKIDLIFLRKDILFLIELKPRYNQGDITKLNEITSQRLNDLYDALEERCNLNRRDIKQIIKCIGVGTLNSYALPIDFLGFIVEGEDDVKIEFGEELKDLRLFED